MKTLIATAALVLPLVSAPAHADGGDSCHFHGSKPASAETVTTCAAQRKARLIKQGKLDASWDGVKADAAEQVDGRKGKEWRLKFHNAAAPDKSQQTLFMFYTLPGNFIAANFSGR